MTRFRVPRWLLWIGLPVLAVAALLAIGPWDLLIPLVEGRASAALGRPVQIEHLHVQLGRTTRITAEGLRIGNPEGFPADPPFAEVPRASLDLDMAALLRDRSLVIPVVELERPSVQVIGHGDGSRNYAFDLGGGGASGTTPRIGAVRIRDGRAHVGIDWLKADFAVNVETRDPLGQEPSLVGEARGTYAGQPIAGRFEGGAVLNLRDADRPWPVEMRVENGPTVLALTGTARDPLHLGGADLRLELAGPDMALLTPLTGVPLPKTPPYRLSGRVDYAEGKVLFRDAEGRLGRSDIAGNLGITTAGWRPEVTAELHSRRVDLADLGGFIGSQPGRVSTPGQTPQQRQAVARAEASPRLLPATPVNMPRLTAADVHLTYRADRIEGKDMPFDSLETRLDIENGVVTLHPVAFGIGRGRMTGNFVLTPQEGGALHAKGEIELRRVDLSRLLGAAGVGGAGTLGGVGRIEGQGRSLAEILGRGNGELTLVSVGGNVNSLLVDLSGLQFGNALLSALGIPARTGIECLIADFGLRRGTLDGRTLLLDTETSLVTGSGSIDLGKEALDLRLRTAAKHPTIGSLPTTIGIAGSLKDPSIVPEVGEMVARGGAAAALGMLFPPLALLPTIQLGVGENSACEKLQAGAGRGAPAEGGSGRAAPAEGGGGGGRRR